MHLYVYGAGTFPAGLKSPGDYQANISNFTRIVEMISVRFMTLAATHIKCFIKWKYFHWFLYFIF